MRRAKEAVLIAWSMAASMTASRAQDSPLVLDPFPPVKPGPAADRDAITQWLRNGCESVSQAVRIHTLLYHDFAHDGRPKLILVASTCFTGNGGPDVHLVLSPDGRGGFQMHEIPAVDRRYFEGMARNRNFDLSVQNGMLVATWWDNSGRPDSPLIVRYRWNGAGFTTAAVEVPDASKPDRR